MTARRRFDKIIDDPIKQVALLGTMRTETPVSKEDFIFLTEKYPDLQIEREKNGKLQIMSPVKFGSGSRESIVLIYLGAWWLKDKIGKTFSASTGIDLPDGSTKSPDCGWVSDKKLKTLTAEEKEGKFLKVVPEFIVEVRSKTDRISVLKKKMTDSWMKNGVELAWLIDPYKEKVYIYRTGKKVKVVEGFSKKKLKGESVMPGMELPLDDLKIMK